MLNKLEQIKIIQDFGKKISGKENIVIGEGNLDAEIFIIGEALGEDEELLGRPFMGKSGRLLNWTLKLLKIKREDVYLTNVLPFRPDGNRTPKISEVRIYSSLLSKLIDVINPKVILCLGKIAASALELLPHLQEIKIIKAYHPAFILRNPYSQSIKKKYWNSFLELKHFIIFVMN